ncbi:prolyl 4-hydroxylase subunit alpha-1-like [Episyrphus balteatus]|uniref:prolyl 4-hydroxylase subunit alpha-1-like n=1 Tax=Episyrphus balteatus TaxID=286459 RepID=UPI002484D9AF|nr:prolyl 4-hydroxylase subunit alpha-1-like [Episyrphus balteatus]
MTHINYQRHTCCSRTLWSILRIAFIISALTLQVTRTEVFTALAEMEELLETESVLLSNLVGYIGVQQHKLNYLKNKVEEYRREHTEASADISTYVSNPINAYLLTKRLTSDWKQVENLMAQDVGSEFLKNITNYRTVLKFPSDEDLNGAAVALMRLQDTYNLDTSSVARGQLNGVQYSTEMSSDDCFEMGRQSYVNSDYYHTVLWMQEAMSRLLEEPVNRTTSFSKADVLEYLAFSTYKQGNLESALTMTNELLEIVPDHERASGNKVFYEKELKELQASKTIKKKVKRDDGSEDIAISDLPIELKEEPEIYDHSERKVYEMLCRGDLKPNPSQLKHLRCRYVNNGIPFLRLAPFKLEEIHDDPMIVIYHDVMYDSEIELVKKMAKPRFRRATVQNAKTGELETAHYRISKSSWLKTEEHPSIGNIVQRTADMTGLDMAAAEELQVVNYGIGGHYEPHFDFARKEESRAFHSLGTGNRIATVLFYMSDVEQGGATVFTALRKALQPKKGTAAFWWNLHKSGEGDFRTRHAACPVLTGSKWVSNKWIHERGQEFIRPCGLEPDHGEFAI